MDSFSHFSAVVLNPHVGQPDTVLYSELNKKFRAETLTATTWLQLYTDISQQTHTPYGQTIQYGEHMIQQIQPTVTSTAVTQGDINRVVVTVTAPPDSLSSQWRNKA